MCRSPGGSWRAWGRRSEPTTAGSSRMRPARRPGVSRPGVMQRLGVYPPPSAAPDTPGLKAAGTVVAPGTGVQRLGVGDGVCACPKALACPGRRAAGNLFYRVEQPVRPGAPAKRCWCTGSSSGIGTITIQLAPAFGARAIPTADPSRRRSMPPPAGAGGGAGGSSSPRPCRYKLLRMTRPPGRLPGLPQPTSRWPASCWTALLLVVALVGAQWTVLHHTHASDGLAPECQVCEQAPAFAHAAPSATPVLPKLAAPTPLPAPTPTPQGRRPFAPRARGPPAFVLH